MACDLVHTGEIVDAVIAVLKGSGTARTGGLPANWFLEGDDGLEVPLQLLEHGDLADYSAMDPLAADCPAILVRGLGCRPTGKGGTGGVYETEELIRVVHIRRYDQQRTATGAVQRNACRAREAYAKAIGKALLNDPQKKLAVISSMGARTEVSLTSADGDGAQVVNCLFGGWDLGQEGPTATEDVRRLRELAAPLWAIACELRVIVRNGA